MATSCLCGERARPRCWAPLPGQWPGNGSRGWSADAGRPGACARSLRWRPPGHRALRGGKMRPPALEWSSPRSAVTSGESSSQAPAPWRSCRTRCSAGSPSPSPSLRGRTHAGRGLARGRRWQRMGGALSAPSARGPRVDGEVPGAEREGCRDDPCQ
eukprot:8637226-Heterocapsa_arctica.AAC.4